MAFPLGDTTLKVAIIYLLLSPKLNFVYMNYRLIILPFIYGI